jgi:hypothetical protein
MIQVESVWEVRRMAIRKVLDSVLQDSAPGNICAGMQRLGINAQIAVRGRYEESIGKVGDSLGIIDIPEGPIRWINVCRVYYRTGQLGGNYNHHTAYGVPDSSLEPSWRSKRIRTVRVKTFPLFGKVVDLRWKGDDFSQEIIRRLNEDPLIRDPMMRSRDVEISAYPEHGCWILFTANPRKEAPPREVWDCYQRIARHLTGQKQRLE